MRNIIFIEDSRWRDGILDGMHTNGFNDFGYTCAVVGPDRIKTFLETERDIGCFAIVGKDGAKYASSFPNNFVMLDENDISKTCRSIIYIMTNFGRDSYNVKVWITSDTHFFHESIIRYCDRPWSNAEEMNSGLIERWNSVVGPTDKVIHLGDFSFGGKSKIQDIMKKLNGKIDIILGNHDRLRVKDYYELGFHRVYDRPIVYNNNFILSHTPLHYLRNSNFFNIFGHVHNMSSYETWTKNSCCVCVERHDYKPVSFEYIKETIKTL